MTVHLGMKRRSSNRPDLRHVPSNGFGSAYASEWPFSPHNRSPHSTLTPSAAATDDVSVHRKVELDRVPRFSVGAVRHGA